MVVPKGAPKVSNILTGKKNSILVQTCSYFKYDSESAIHFDVAFAELFQYNHRLRPVIDGDRRPVSPLANIFLVNLIN